MAYLWMPNTIRVWMLHVFLDQKACYEQYKNYTFTKRLGWNKTFAAIVAKIVSSFVTNLMKSGRGIPVYRGSRDILKTFQISVNTLKNGQTVAIFPDIDYQDSTSEVKEMYEGFLFLEKYYFRETGQHVNFVPLYVSESKRRIVADKVISFQSNGSFRKESKLILKQIQDHLNQLAKDCGDI